MGRTNYDDWNFMGETRRDDHRVRSLKPAKQLQITNQRNSFIFLCVICLLTFLGLVCIYSASFESAVSRGLDHYYFLIKQISYTLIGIALAIIVNIIPEKGIKILSPIMFFASLALLVCDTFLGTNYLSNCDCINFLFLSGVMYMSLYFAGRDNDITNFKQIIVPVIACLIVLGLILMQKNFAYSLMYLGITVTMFAAGGVGIVGIIILLLYAAVPIVCMILSKSDRILSIARLFIPGFGVNQRAGEIMNVRAAIASGSWFGKGLGGGIYKDSIISDIAGKNILSLICEELGFWGLVTIVIFIGFYAFVGYRIAKVARKQKGFYSNMAVGITTMVVWQFILNICWVLGYLPSEGLPMPFFSYGIGIIPVLLESGLLYKITRVKIESEDNERIIESIQDELMFPEKYIFENN